ncbi:MAG: hypothetical protein IPJ88_14590 [Myxococcales bacterium]|nr:MAG: hypothetical protein IPJ88_14590 [Myxococcales bacterium]
MASLIVGLSVALITVPACSLQTAEDDPVAQSDEEALGVGEILGLATKIVVIGGLAYVAYDLMRTLYFGDNPEDDALRDEWNQKLQEWKNVRGKSDASLSELADVTLAALAFLAIQYGKLLWAFITDALRTLFDKAWEVVANALDLDPDKGIRGAFDAAVGKIANGLRDFFGYNPCDAFDALEQQVASLQATGAPPEAIQSLSDALPDAKATCEEYIAQTGSGQTVEEAIQQDETTLEASEITGNFPCTDQGMSDAAALWAGQSPTVIAVCVDEYLAVRFAPQKMTYSVNSDTSRGAFAVANFGGCPEQYMGRACAVDVFSENGQNLFTSNADGAPTVNIPANMIPVDIEVASGATGFIGLRAFDDEAPSFIDASFP